MCVSGQVLSVSGPPRPHLTTGGVIHAPLWWGLRNETKHEQGQGRVWNNAGSEWVLSFPSYLVLFFFFIFAFYFYHS